MVSSSQAATSVVEQRGWLNVPSGKLVLAVSLPPQYEQRNGTEIRRGVAMMIGTGGRNGPQNYFVDFSRALASRGLPCMRLDYSYFGDGWNTDQAPLRIGTMRAEARVAIKYFRDEFALDEIILLGLCTGGEIALSLAPELPEVSRLVLWSTAAIESPLTITKHLKHTRSMLGQYLQKLSYPATWRKLLRGDIDVGMVQRALIKRQVAPDTEKQAALVAAKGRQPQPQPKIFVYGGSDPDQAKAVRYYRRLYQDHAEIRIIPETGHSFTSLTARDQLFRLTLDWLRQQGMLREL